MLARSWLPSLRSRLVLLTLVLVIPALAAAGIAVYAGYRHDRHEVEKHLQETARALSLVVDRQFGQAEALLWALSTSPQLLEKDYAAFDARARAAIRLPGTWVVVADDEKQLANTLLPPGSPLPIIPDNTYRKGLVPGTIRISNLFLGTAAKQPAVAVDTLVTTREGSELFVSVIMLAERVSRILADQGLPPSWIGTIMDRNGTVVARSRDAARFAGKPAPPDGVARVQTGVSQGVWESVSLDGVPTVVALSRSPGSGWSTIVAVPQTEITAPAWRFALYLSAAGGLLLAGGVAMAWRVGRSIATPVEGLATIAHRMGRGAPVTAHGSGLAEADRVAQALASASAELRTREAALRASEARLRATHENAAVGITEVDRDGHFISVNEARCQLTGHSRDELIGKHFGHVTDPEIREHDLELFARQVAGELNTYTTESKFRRKDGSSGWARVTSTAVRDGDGTFLYAVRVVEDITERRQADRRQKLLIDELNHRVKNTLATVQSLAWQAARPGVPPKVAQERFQERLLALSRTHNLLNETHWEGASLRAILETELGPYLTPLSLVRIGGPQVDLSARVAVVLGMAFHELATNAAKHGALSSERGRVQVDWKVDTSGGGTVLTVDWCELDGPVPEVQPVRGFGSRLLEQTVTRELAGQLDLRFERGGVCCTMTIPMEAGADRAA
ncbi:PAS domain S-box protein [Microvirga sp. HBU67558]|uniref:sensor histidine kinase n=1 Tax=Microvirga TaxID=186650 RepID=UPI001B35AD3A|nr:MULTISPECIES: PAS domain S-box protein [unclassified Microvirga]MBQ0822460.1 PAS domain S-box protein [Microvirga sp. HBU67558]